MSTSVGQEDKLVDALVHLMELDFDAIAAYQTAIERLESFDIKRAMQKFLLDHWRHIHELEHLITALGGKPPTSGDLKGALNTGRVLIGQLAGEAGILSAMHTSEDDTHIGYERVLGRADLCGSVRNVISRGLQDERRHRAWLEDRLSLLKKVPSELTQLDLGVA